MGKIVSTKRVKLLGEKNSPLQNLEQEINRFLATNKIELIDIKITGSPNNTVAALIYKPVGSDSAD